MKSPEEKPRKVETTGQMRTLLANAAKAVVNGEMEVDDALALHKLAKNLTESLYSEAKMRLFRQEAGQKDTGEIGDLWLGDPRDKPKA